MFWTSQQNIKITAAHKQTLQTLVIDQRGPGTILRDFDMLLSLLKEAPLSVTPASQLALVSVNEINKRMTYPLKLGLQRPSNKSYPHILGLYLLARASGLTYIDNTGKKPLLILDGSLYQQWTQLNPTERYCTLLETWMLRGREEILGERGRYGQIIPDNFDNVGRLISEIEADGLPIAGNRDKEEDIKYVPGWYNFGLMDLFGLVRVEEAPIKEGAGWQVKAIHRTPLGDAMIAVLFTIISKQLKEMYRDLFSDDTSSIRNGVWQPMLEPYFPQWKNTFVLPESAFRDGIHVFKVSLGKKLWRRIAIDGKAALDELALQICNAFDFDMDHLYKFTWKTRFGYEESANHSYMEEPISTSEMLVGQVPITVGQSMVYLFDFGDSWEFDVTLEKVDSDKIVKQLGLIETHGDAPEQYPSWDDDDDFDEDDEDNDVINLFL